MRMPCLVPLAPFSPMKSYSGGGLSRWTCGSSRHGCCSDLQDLYSRPAAEHLPHVHGARCSQVPAVVPVLLSVAGVDPQYPEKWDLSSQCSLLHARIYQRSHPSYSWPCYSNAPGRSAPLVHPTPFSQGWRHALGSGKGDGALGHGRGAGLGSRDRSCLVA